MKNQKFGCLKAAEPQDTVSKLPKVSQRSNFPGNYTFVGIFFILI